MTGLNYCERGHLELLQRDDVASAAASTEQFILSRRFLHMPALAWNLTAPGINLNESLTVILEENTADLDEAKRLSPHSIYPGLLR